MRVTRYIPPTPTHTTQREGLEVALWILSPLENDLLPFPLPLRVNAELEDMGHELWPELIVDESGVISLRCPVVHRLCGMGVVLCGWHLCIVMVCGLRLDTQADRGPWGHRRRSESE